MANVVFSSVISDIPWEEDPSFSQGSRPAYLAHFRYSFDRIPVAGGRIPFRDDVWDFNPCFDGFNDDKLRIRFSGLPAEIKTHCKFWALRMLEERRVSTVQGRVLSFKGVVARALSESDHGTFVLLTTDDIVAAIEGAKRTPGTLSGLYRSCCKGFRFLKANCGMGLAVDETRLDELAISNGRKAKKMAEKRKTPDIPLEYFDRIIAKAISVMRDESAAHNRRATACLLVMLTQLGMRIQDLLALRTHQLHEKKLRASGLVANFIRYETRKPSASESSLINLDIASNRLCTEAFNTLAAIRDGCLLGDKEDFLYVLDPVARSSDSLPVSRNRFRNEYINFLAEELAECSLLDWKGIPKTLVPNSDIRISVPSTPQYRVRLCTALHERGVPQLFIQRYMGHLSEAMQGYYARPKDPYQECIGYTESLIEDIAVNDVRLLGGRYGDEIKAGILDFIERNGLDARKDVGEIVAALGPNVIVRAKEGGCCIKTSIMPCSKDARSNELLCAYNLCPNLFHRYHAADVTCANLFVMQEAYSDMVDAGKTRMAEKELNKIKDLCRRRLLPELDELDREIGRQGEDGVLSKHPHLRDVVAGRKEIREEAIGWMGKKTSASKRSCN